MFQTVWTFQFSWCKLTRCPFVTFCTRRSLIQATISFPANHTRLRRERFTSQRRLFTWLPHSSHNFHSGGVKYLRAQRGVTFKWVVAETLETLCDLWSDACRGFRDAGCVWMFLIIRYCWSYFVCLLKNPFVSFPLFCSADSELLDFLVLCFRNALIKSCKILVTKAIKPAGPLVEELCYHKLCFHSTQHKKSLKTAAESSQALLEHNPLEGLTEKLWSLILYFIVLLVG